jgi:hypothetical protein
MYMRGKDQKWNRLVEVSSSLNHLKVQFAKLVGGEGEQDVPKHHRQKWAMDLNKSSGPCVVCLVRENADRMEMLISVSRLPERVGPEGAGANHCEG